MSILGYINLALDNANPEAQDHLEIVRKATGKDLYYALINQAHGQSMEATLIQMTCNRNGQRMSIDAIENLDADISDTIAPLLFDQYRLVSVKNPHPQSENSPLDLDFPKRYKAVPATRNFYQEQTTHELTLLRKRTIRDTAHAQKLSGNNSDSMAFWLLSLLVEIDGQKVRYDDLMDMSAGLVQVLLPLISTKKRTIVRPKT